MKKIIYIICFVLISSISYAGPQTASSTTGTVMIAKVRVLLDESSALRWADADLLQYLNDGMKDIAAKALCYQNSEDIDLVADTVEYTPTTNYISIIGVTVNPSSGPSWGLKKANIRSIGSSVTSDIDAPEYYYESAGKVGVYPAYTSISVPSGETITVKFARLPTTITAGQNILTPAVFDNALMYYIVAQALVVDGRIQEANNYRVMYVQELNLYRRDFVGVDNETSDPIR